jgi:DNA polymerase-1
MTNPFAGAIAQAAQEQPTEIQTRPKVPGLTVHVDGDYLAYYASGNDECEPGTARMNAFNLIEKFSALTGATNAVVHNTASGCHKGERYLAATVKPYQGQRDGSRRPRNYPYLRELLLNYTGDAFRTKVWTTREADDGFGACAYFAVGNPAQAGYAALATADKDMRMLPGLHIDWTKLCLTTVKPGEYEVIGPNDKIYGLKWFWLQMLMGDTADNCPGLEYIYLPVIPGKEPKMTKCGEKTALKALQGIDNHEDAYRAVADYYRYAYRGLEPKAGWPVFAYDRFVEQAALMWMRTGPKAELIDFAQHKGPGGFSHLFDQAMWDAVERLDKRVKAARAELDQYDDSLENVG